MRSIQSSKWLKWLLVIWLICLILCLAQISFIANYYMGPISGAEVYHKVDSTMAKNEAIQHFISQGPTSRDNRHFYPYNVIESNNIGSFRSIPDTRDLSCSKRFYFFPKQNQSVSVIIAFHNEARVTLLRTIVSLYQRTSPHHLHEIILIDDFSEDETLLQHLGKLNFPPFDYESKSGRVGGKMKNGFGSSSMTQPLMTTIKMQRNPYRLGLIESRNRGALAATGDYLLFLDSHCEVNVGWLEPLLDRLTFNSIHNVDAAVSPVLDIIDTKSLKYRSGSSSLMGAFDWNLHFHWLPRYKQPQEAYQTNEPFKSPTFAGGIFLISRNWFFKLNAFNSLLQIWGGEAIEFSIKVWLCGGEIEIVPCSRIGHIFFQKHPFKFQVERDPSQPAATTNNDIDGQATYLRNSKIIAESWLDNYKYFFYTSKPEARDMDFDRRSIDGILVMKKKLNCHPFAWYMSNVFPDLRLPSDEFIAYGTLSSNEQCVHVQDDSNSPSNSLGHFQLHMRSCYTNDITHWFLHRQNAHLHSSNGICLNVSASHSKSRDGDVEGATATNAHNRGHVQWQFALKVEYCDTSSTSQRWIRRGPFLIHERTRLCLDNPVADSLTI